MATKSNNPTNSIMEKLLASQDKKFITLSRGQQVEGEIVSISDKEITLDLGAKSEGVLQRRETRNNPDVKIGSKIKVFVAQAENESGQIVVSTTPQMRIMGGSDRKGGSRGAVWSRFMQAQSSKSKISGKVLEVNKGGLVIEVDTIRGFLPNSQVGFELMSKAGGGMDSLIGQTLSLTVIEVDQNNNKLIFTQRGQVSEAIKDKLKQFKSGEKVKGKVVAVLPFGLVVDINGVEGLVFISDVAWEKVEDLTTMFKSGEEVEVVIIGADEELGRLNLSMKQLSEDPFTKITQKYPVDEVVKGEVMGVSEAGVTIKLDGVEGLLSANKMKSDTSYEVGKAMSFLVDSVDSRKRIINLASFVTTTSDLIYK